MWRRFAFSCGKVELWENCGLLNRNRVVSEGSVLDKFY
ncbi:MAG: hypothetical protein RHS_0223 [Robinsoniella sp. RHS]|nr:MAG: hypothetical protein RHS_0223 [Robinsoniella sp. RHS]